MHFAATAAADIAVYVGRLRHRPKAPVHCTLTHMHTHRHTSHWLHGTPKTDRQQTIGQKGACHTCPIAVQFSGATEIHAYFENLFIAHTPQSVKNIFSLGIFFVCFCSFVVCSASGNRQRASNTRNGEKKTAPQRSSRFLGYNSSCRPESIPVACRNWR